MATGHDIAMGLRAAYLLMHRQTNSYLSGFDMTADQFVLLSLLAGKDGITQQELTQRASSDPNTIRAMLVLMEKNGLVKRDEHPSDSRAKSVILTQTGQQTYAKLSKIMMGLQEALLSPFKTKESTELVKFLDSISGAMIKLESEQKPRK